MNTARHITVATAAASGFGSHAPEILKTLCRDATARALALRYARFDPDVRALVMSCDAGGWPAGWGDRIEGSDPRDWGFEPMPDGYFWTAGRLFDGCGLPSDPPARPEMTRPRVSDQFDEINSPPDIERGDPLQHERQLRQIRIIAEVWSARGLIEGGMCHRLAVALGNCRIFGVRLQSSVDFSLSVRAATLAAEHLIQRVREQEQACGAPHADSDVETAATLLEARMEAWASYLAIEEALAAAMDEGCGDHEELSKRVKTLRRAMGRLDGNLQNHIPLLRPAAATNLLSNWRRLLAPPCRDLPPWWLDGCIG